MDNCGFHHAILTENPYVEMLADHGVEFLKGWLRARTGYAGKYTEIAILDALSYITPQISHNYFRKCGYVD